jgi:Potassium-transporting ATPase A subunit
VHDARSSNVRAGLGPRNSEPHGLLEILYAYTSTMANNGQVFGDLSANSPFYNLTTVVAMFMGRFALGVLALWLAGIFVGQQRRPATPGMLPKDALQFAVVIAGTALLVGGLSFLPVVSLGPVVEQLLMAAGHKVGLHPCTWIQRMRGGVYFCALCARPSRVWHHCICYDESVLRRSDRDAAAPVAQVHTQQALAPLLSAAESSL